MNREIERQIALNGGVTADTAIARLGLAFREKTPQDVANYIARYRDQFFEQIDKTWIISLEITMLSRGGFPERAKERLSVLIAEGISDSEANHFRRMISDAEDNDPIEMLKEQFKETGGLSDLLKLVLELEAREEWGDLCEYGAVLFEETRSLQDAERLARALSTTQSNERLFDLLKANSTLRYQSENLQMLYCWSLYHEGALLDARSELQRLSGDRDDPNRRALQINIGIAIGDWTSLLEFVANEFREKDKRSASDMIRAAKLGLHLGSPNAKDLLFAAARKGDDDAGILANAYFLAASADLENDAEVYQWLHKAAELSGVDGPFRKMSLKDIFDRKPDWDRRESQTWQQLSRGEIPMCVAGQLLNRSLSDFVLFPALTNLSENDPRRKRVVPAYSGMRQPRTFDTGGPVGIEATALLTLSMLNLLDDAFETFDKVYIPHSTLAWLFEEKQKASFHQPSRIRDAHHLRDLLATDSLEKFIPSTAPDSGLAAQVGEELATMIAEAEGASDDTGPQRVVVRPAPVYRVGSLMDEEADLTAHSAVISSCQYIVDKCRQKGQLTAEEEKKALSYFQLREKPWSAQPEIADGAVLYLTDLAVTFLLRLGVLEKLKASGFRPIISSHEMVEANQLIAYEKISTQVDRAIEGIRSTVSAGIEVGKVAIGRSIHFDHMANNPIADHPSIGAVALATNCDVIITDDRYLNQHASIDSGDGSTRIFTTLDLIDRFASASSITTERWLAVRTFLRRAGYIFVPVSREEVKHLLDASAVVEGKVIETAELKSIRESLLRVRLSTWLLLPKEKFWLDSLLGMFIEMLKDLWIVGTDMSAVRARSDWLLDQIDVRGWAHCLGEEGGDNIVQMAPGGHIMLLLSLPADASPKLKDEYWAWLEETLLTPIEEEDSDLYSWIVARCRQYIEEMDAIDLPEENADLKNDPYFKPELAQAMLEHWPPHIRMSLLEDPAFREQYGFTMNPLLSLGNSGFSVQRSVVFDAVRSVFSDAPEMEIIDIGGQKWDLKNISGEGEAPCLTLCRGKQRLTLPDLSPISSDRSTRLRSLERAASEVNLPARARDVWRNVLSDRSLTDDDLGAFQSELRDTPVGRARSLMDEFFDGHLSVLSFVPKSRRYFERLVGTYDGSSSVGDYAAGSGRTLFQELSAWRAYDGFLYSLFLSAHSALTAEIDVDLLSVEDLRRAFEFLEESGDRISQVGAIEVGLRVLSARPEIEAVLIRLIERMRVDDVEGEASGFRFLSALFVLIDGELSRNRLFATEPPFYRRLAAFAQAALVHQQFVLSGAEIERFSEWTLNNRGQLYYLQSLVDLRTEPRWAPDLASASQLKAEFLGRVRNAANAYKENIKANELRELVLGTDSGSLDVLSVFPSYLPGPLEGAYDPQNPLPVEFYEAIETQLGSDPVGPSSFFALVNFSLIFPIDRNQVASAAKALKLSSYRFANIEDKSQLVAILRGLAMVSAVARSNELAEELRILVRRYRRDTEYSLSVEEAMTIGLVAAACHPDLKNWRAFVGDWLTELAFEDLEDNEGKILRSHLKCLCHVIPELWVTCGRAIAALDAFNDR